MTDEELARQAVGRVVVDLDAEFEILDMLGLLDQEEVDDGQQ